MRGCAIGVFALAVLGCQGRDTAVQPEAPITAPAMRHRIDRAFDGIVYVGMDGPAKVKGGETFTVTHYWLLRRPLAGWKVFTHLRGKAGEFANLDHTFERPFEQWPIGTVLSDRHTVRVPATWESPTVDIVSGLFRGDERLNVAGSEADNVAVTIDVAPSALVEMRRSYGKKLYSQLDEETLLRAYFKDRKGGTFVDIGSAHWRDMSTTLYLEKHLGWRGVAVDANPNYRHGYEANRPNTRFVSFFVSDKSDDNVSFYFLPTDTPLGSGKKEHLLKYKHIRDVKDQIQEIKVQTVTMTDLLAAAKVTKIDFLSMDIEGFEMKALAGFDIARFAPELICIETDHAGRNEIHAWFVAHGYRRLDDYLKLDAHNTWYVPAAR